MREQHGLAVNDFNNFDKKKLSRYLITALVTGAAAGAIGPYGTFDSIPAGPRFFYWMTVVFLGWSQMLICCYSIRGFIGRGRLEGWPTMLLAVMIGGIPITFEVRWMTSFVEGESANLGPLWFSYSRVFVVTFLFSLLQWLTVERWSLFPKPCVEGPIGKIDKLDQPISNSALRMRRMPEGLTGEILCLETEDHYLRVHTDGGNGLILCRLSDASSELSHHNGMQVHRSWWVAQRAVVAVETINRQKVLILKNELKVPVSKSYVDKVKKAGWFD